MIHLAAIPHPGVRGVTEDDLRRVNFDGSVNVFEAARTAGVARFVFASSAQVYGINDPVCLDQLPILESNRCPTLEEGQSMYGHLKREFERYLAAACLDGQLQASSLRLEYPGVRAVTPANQYISTSVGNLVAGFVCALEAPDTFAFEAFNLADSTVDPSIVDIQQFIRSRWPGYFGKRGRCRFRWLSQRPSCTTPLRIRVRPGPSSSAPLVGRSRRSSWRSPITSG